jgi:tetratricopeptide (TPR) repeat protein
MNSIPCKILSKFTLICLLNVSFVFGQATDGMTSKTLFISKARDLFKASQFSAANAHIQSYFHQFNASGQLNESDKSELQLMMLVSGINARETYSVKNARVLMETTEEKSVAVKLAYHLGHYYFGLSMYDDAIANLEKTDPLYLDNEENERVQYEKGVSYFSLKKFDNARPFFRSIIQLEQSVYKADVQYYLGFVDFSEKRYNDASGWFREIEDHPYYKKAVPFYQAFIAHETGKIEKAIQYGEAYLTAGDGIHLREMQQLLASIYSNKGDHSKAVALYEKVLAAGIALNPTQRFELGAGYYHQKKYSKAIEQLKPLSAGSDKVSLESMYLLGQSYLQINDKSSARNAFQYVLDGKLGKEQTSMARFQFAKLSMELGFEDQGLQGLTKFLKEESSSIYIKECKEILLAHYAKTNNYRQAIVLLENIGASSASIMNVAPRIYYGRAIELVIDLQYDQADQLFSQMIRYKSSPFYAASLFWRGELAYRRSDYLSCINHLLDYIKIPSKGMDESNIENAWYNLGYSYFEQEEYTKALPWFEKIYGKTSTAAIDVKREAMLRAADCAFMEKQIEKAKSLYAQVFNADGFGTDYASFQLAIIEGIKSPSGKINLLRAAEKKFASSAYLPLITAELADTYMSEEQYDQAIPYLKRIPSLVGEDDELIPESLLKLGIAYYNLDKPDESAEQFRRLLKEYPASGQASEALESARSLYVESGRIDEYEKFLQTSGMSLGALQKDSLSFQFVQKTYADGNTRQSLSALDSYINSFPDGLFIAEVLNYKAELMQKDKDWASTAKVYDQLAAKGVSKYQEKALRQSGRIYFFELKDFASALQSFKQLSATTSKPDVLLESRRGEVRCYFYLKLWEQGNDAAKALLENESSTNDDKAFAYMVMGYAAIQQRNFAPALSIFTSVAELNKSALGAEARYQKAFAYFSNEDLANAEKYALESIEVSGSYEFWITKSYMLLGEIFFVQKDYFNAKATLKSVVENCSIPALKQEAMTRLQQVETAEKGGA